MKCDWVGRARTQAGIAFEPLPVHGYHVRSYTQRKVRPASARTPTVTFWRAIRETWVVGIMDSSPKGSSSMLVESESWSAQCRLRRLTRMSVAEPFARTLLGVLALAEALALARDGKRLTGLRTCGLAISATTIDESTQAAQQSPQWTVASSEADCSSSLDSIPRHSSFIACLCA